ncbi:MAG: right-handed parallel beta-helix repeat-containing protein [Limisphaerales bacterium]
MNPKPTGSPLISVLFLAALFVLAPMMAFGQAPRLDSPHVTNGVVEFNVIGLTNAYHRVDSSRDLLNWLPIDAYLDAGVPHPVSDPLASVGQAQFYRAVNTDPALGVFDFSPASGPPGTQVTIIGQFFPPPSQVLARIGGTDAAVLSSTSTRLVVRVPANAVTGRITVLTGADAKTSSGVFVVQANAVVTFTPPAGIQAQDFEINNNYGTAVPLANPAGAFSIPVRNGSPNLTFATPNNTHLAIFFCAVSLDASQPIAITAASTAEALVFQDSHLLVQDPDLAASVLAAIHTNAAVRAFAQVLAQQMVQTQSPLTNATVSAAYQTAVVSVVGGAGVQALAANIPRPPTTGRAAKASVSGIQIYPLEFPKTRFLDVTANGTGISVGIDDAFFSPVDWLVAFQKVDVAKAFPNGRIDFNRIQQTIEDTPQLYPLLNDFYAERSVSANHVSSRINLVSTLAKAAYSALIPTFIDDTVQLPDNDAIYLVRGVGPSLVTPEDFDFVNTRMADVYVRIVGLNLAAAAMELASLVVGDSGNDAVAKLSELQGLASEALKKAPGVRTVEDFEQAAYSLAESLIQDFAKAKIEDALGNAIKFVGDNVVSINNKLKKAAAVGQLVERASGLFRTTALETTFVVAGDPFQLQIISVAPSIASPGQDITVQFKGSPALRPFDTNSTTDDVTFEGSLRLFDGQVTAVGGPDALGIQTLKVRIPASLGNSADGPYTLYVNTQGRRGSTAFTLSTSAALAGVTPVQGFAAAADFVGSPFPGTRVHLQGAVFKTTDTFLFAGGTTGVEATNKSTGGATSGDVYVYVPPGATTGPLQILHPLTNGTSLQITGPVFTVFGPPHIQAVQPLSAPPGTVLNLSVSNVGNDATMVYSQFTGTPPLTVSLLPNSIVTVGVPNQAQTGPLAIITPAGSDQTAFIVLPPVPFAGQTGAGISVGGNSPITLKRAIALATGDGGIPVDGPDDSTDPNYPMDELEEGDFVSPDKGAAQTPRWALGPQYSNAIGISGVNTEDADISINYGSVGGGELAGNITISGHNNTISGIFSGTVVVTGYSNRFNGATFRGPATFVSNNNFIDHGTVQAPMTMLGENNNINLTAFQGVTGNALTLKGNRNVLLLNLWTNTGDGLVINGGKYNQVTVNSMRGNGGNGVTLTGGAEGNTLTVLYDSRVTAGGGNLGHGIALIGNAVANEINGDMRGNGLDGMYLDGPGVTLNQFLVGGCEFNGRNGITMTNGASGNSVGILRDAFGRAFTLQMNQNGGNGVALLNCGPNQIAVWPRTNALCGVLVSHVNVDPSGLDIHVDTTRNGKAGLRLEQGTAGVRAFLRATEGYDDNELELDGGDVTGNQIEVQVSDAIHNGVLLRGAHNNDLTIDSLDHNGADGLLLQGASNNVISLFAGSSNNTSNGIHVTFGSCGNHFTCSAGAPFLAIMTDNLNGIVFDTDSHDNVMELMGVGTNRQDGLVFSGASSNSFVRSSVSQVARDGIRFENGAHDNIIGSDAADDAFNTREISVEFCGAAGVRMTGAGTVGNLLRRCLILGQPSGIVVESGADAGLITRSTLSANNDGIVIRDGASDGALINLSFTHNTNTAITITNASNIRIGGPADSDHNELSQSRTGLDISGPGATNNILINNHIIQGTDGVYVHDGAQANLVAGANLIEGNLRGIRIEAAYGNLVRASIIQSNQTAGIQIGRGATNNTVEASTVTNNSVGVLVSDNGTVGNSVLGNSITRNSGKGIQLSNGGNAGLLPPLLQSYFGVTVDGTADVPDGSRVEIFRDSDDEGETWLGAGLVASGRFRVPVSVDPAAVGVIFRLNGTVTDPQGDTSEFSGPFNPEFPLSALAFSSFSTGNREVFLWDGRNNPVNVTQNPADDHTPALGSLSGCNQLLFVSTRTGKQNIFVMTAQAGASPRLVITNTANNYDPAWLTNCQSLVFTSDQDGPSHIYSVNLGGTNLKRLTTSSANDHAPKATMDGSKIVFMSDRSGVDAIYVMNADGTDQHPVGTPNGGTSQPAFSPDGSLIAFTRILAGKGEIWTTTADGTTSVQVTKDGAYAAHPAWLLDGEHLIFSSNKAGNTQLYTVSRIGGPSQPLPISTNADEPSVGGP